MTAVAYRTQRRVAAFRKQLGLSQPQFGDLFMTTERTVKRWESGQLAMTPHQQYFLERFAEYVKRKGLKAFRRRFAAEQPRYGKRGRPARL